MTAKFCTTCYAISKPRTKTPGSILIEIVLWLCFLVPGIIYSLWRLTNRQEVCGRCGSVTLVPVDSPVAQRALAR